MTTKPNDGDFYRWTMAVSQQLSIAETADLCGVDEEQVTHWIGSGELPATNVAKAPDGKRPRWRVAEDDLAKFLFKRRHPASLRDKSARPL